MLSLDIYLHTQAGQDVRRKANGVFVMTSADDPTRILGYYTLCALALPPHEIPESFRKGLPRYPLISATLIGRLAVSEVFHRQKFGAVLLSDAMQRAYANATIVGSSMIVVDALDEAAVAFYAAHGFVRLADAGRLVLPMKLAAM